MVKEQYLTHYHNECFRIDTIILNLFLIYWENLCF